MRRKKIMKEIDELREEIKNFEIDELRTQVQKLENSVKKVWNHLLILACIMCFTELCDLITFLFE